MLSQLFAFSRQTFFSYLVWTFISAILSVFNARSWASVPCRILTAESNSNYNGNSSVDIKYTYEFNGQLFQSTRYKFLKVKTSFRKTIPDNNLANSTSICFVNPKAPNEAVIDRDLSWDMLFGLIPLIFFIIFGLASFSILWGWKLQYFNKNKINND